jgi:hypothetical protein
VVARAQPISRQVQVSLDNPNPVARASRIRAGRHSGTEHFPMTGVIFSGDGSDHRDSTVLTGRERVPGCAGTLPRTGGRDHPGMVAVTATGGISIANIISDGADTVHSADGF